MSARSTDEWIGASPDAAIPPRVRLRVFDKASGHCTICTRKIGPGDRWQADHEMALINGGANRESNLRLVCDWCHKGKTAADVALKSKTHRVRQQHHGLKPKSRLSHPFLRKKVNGEVVQK